MKNHDLGSLALAVALLPMAWAESAFAQSQQDHVTSFSVRTDETDVVLEKEALPGQGSLTRVRLRGPEPYGLTSLVGWPQLPYLTRVVALPRAAQILSVSVKTGGTVTLPDVPLVAWAQPPQAGQERSGASDSERPPQPPRPGPAYYPRPNEVGLDPAVAQVAAWPKEGARLQAVREFAGYKLLFIHVQPLRWKPRDQVLTLSSDIRVDVRYKGGSTPVRKGGYREAMQLDELRRQVVNPEAIVQVAIPPRARPSEAWYLVLTDNYQWNADMTRGPALDGDVVAEFQRLADWKTAKGVKAAVVTISDIMGGHYGDLTTGARDLPEVVRRFLQRNILRFNTYWVLLGGDTEIIPAREAVGSVWNGSHFLHRGDAARPVENESYWDAATSTVRIHDDTKIGLEILIASRKTGRAFGRVSAPSATRPGWAYATDDTYATESAARTPFIVLRGSLEDTEQADFYSVQLDNRIPTDLYYASLRDELYGLPGRHDWDQNGNGLYGQYNGAESTDGVEYLADVALGRAPINDTHQARAFVDKVMAYERYQGRTASFARRLLLSSTNWGRNPQISQGPASPPPVGRYYSAAGSTEARLHFDGSPGDGVQWKLVAWNSADDLLEVPYDRSPRPDRLGFHYCFDDTCAAPAEFFFWGYEIPVKTEIVKVVGPSSQIRPARYFFDNTAPDGAVTEKEAVKALFASELGAVQQVRRLYEDREDTPDFPSPNLLPNSEARVRDAFNLGYGLMSLTGHGWSGGCCGLNRDWADELTGPPAGVVYADSCSTSRFDVAAAEAVSEVLLTNPNGGAVGYVGNSRFGWIGDGAPLERAFWHGLSPDPRLPTERRLGRLHNTKGFWADSSTHIWANFALNLMGDPEMPLWVGTPRSLSVLHATGVSRGAGFIVGVRNASGGPVPSATVTVTGPRGQFETRLTGPTGQATFSTSRALVGEHLSVVVTKDDHVPYEGALTVRVPR